MGSQAPVMPDAWMHPLPCPIFGDPPQRGDSFWPRVLGVWQPQGRGPTPSDLCLDAGNCQGPPESPQVGGATHVFSIPLGFILLPQWGLEESEGWLGPSFSSSPADSAASIDTLLTGIDWLGLSGGATQREGSACSRGCGLEGQGPSSQQQTLCTVFSIPVFE